MKYKTSRGFIDDMGSFPSFIVSDKPMETKEEEFLWHLNKVREHDNLKPLELDDLEFGGKFGIQFELVSD